MNIRDHLNRRITPVHVVMLGCFILFGASGFIVTEDKTLFFLPILAFVGFGGAILYLFYGIRCPQCRNSLGQMTYLPKGGYFRLSKDLGYCPFCGISLDTEMGADGQPIVPAQRSPR
jgi:hypothetical protein